MPQAIQDPNFGLALVLFLVCAGLGGWCWVTGRSIVPPRFASRREEPAGYWFATALTTLGAVISIFVVVYLASGAPPL